MKLNGLLALIIQRVSISVFSKQNIMNKSKIVEFEAGKNLTAHDNSKLECSLSPNFKKYLIDRGETYCSQCGKLLKVRK